MSRDNEAQIKRESRSHSYSLAEDERLLPLADSNPGRDAAPPFDPQTHPPPPTPTDNEAADGQYERWVASILGLQRDVGFSHDSERVSSSRAKGTSVVSMSGYKIM